MRVPVEWLREYVETPATVDEISRALTMAGLEIEGAEAVGGGDTVLEVNVTPNRSDCLSVFGVARDLAAILALPLKPPVVEITDTNDPAPVAIEIADPGLCHRYTARMIRGVTVGPSPSWLKRRLEAVGIRPINNIVDITNYVLMELGHPLHAFDLARIRGGKIVVKLAEDGEAFTTLDNVQRKLSGDMLTIRDGEGAVALAGVMGGQNSEVSPQTHDILLESAWFFPPSIRKTSRVLGLRSESSYRFERGTDIVGLAFALDRAAAMIAELAGGAVSGAKIDAYPSKYEPPSISLAVEKVGRILGVEVSAPEMVSILRRLGMNVEEGYGAINVRPPSFRRDIARDIDLIEEIARINGYDKIISKMPSGVVPMPVMNRGREILQRVGQTLRSAGFSEAVNFSFMNPAHLDVLGFADGDQRRNIVTLANPLRAEESALRTTLVPALFANLAWNLNRGSDGLKLYEISKVFINIGDDVLPDEHVRIAAVLTPSAAKRLYPVPAAGFYELKGALEAILRELRINATFAASDSERYLEAGRSAEILIGGRSAGFIGEIRREVLEKFEISADSYVFELYADVVIESAPVSIKYAKLPKFPPVDRDMALLAPLNTQSQQIIDAVLGFGNAIIKSVRVFDVYQGKGIPDGKKSVAFSVRYQAADRTLTDDEVDAAHSSLIGHLQHTLGVELRG
ncbi:MAG: phenylalanine--tRNA ligase subunit beta [Nitrospirae bacterium]|nr:phenylalanine--tRNA ligase subunit beta [Nitrospirota bacterium]